MADFLSEYGQVIRRAKSAVQRHAVIWCIQHLVPLRQFTPGKLDIVFYENLCKEPEREIERVFRILDRPYKESVLRYFDRPSRTSQPTSAVVTGESRVTRWQKRLTSEQVGQILDIVEAFGLESLYGDSPLPICSSSH